MTQLNPPAPHQAFEVIMSDGCHVRLRRHGNPQGVRLLITHGNGFAVEAYYPFWRHLLDAFDVVIFDFRNHGLSDRSDPASHTYPQLAQDLDEVIAGVNKTLGHKTTVGVVHSMSARTAMKHAIEIGWKWDGLILFDPPNVPPPGHPAFAKMCIFESKLLQWVLARRKTFNSIDELTQEYKESRGTARWVEGVHELMARSVLRKDPAGDTWSLVCDPEIEAAIYAAAMTLNLWPKASLFGGPTMLIGCDATSPTAPATAYANQCLGVEQGYDYVQVKDTGHLLQIERPKECADLVVDFVKRYGIKV